MTRVAMTALVAALVVLAAPGLAEARSSDALERALDGIVAARGGPPGLSVLIQRGGRRQFLSRGFSDVRARRRPAVNDHMRIASMSKAFNGAVALGLVSDGRLGLGDTIGERLPGVLPLAGR